MTNIKILNNGIFKWYANQLAINLHKKAASNMRQP